MEETLLNYFTNNNVYNSATIEPININNGIISNLQEMATRVSSMVTNDNNYFIRYGGRPLSNNYNAIEVYDNNSIRNGQPLYVFSDLKIENHSFGIRDLRQDENGRFYAVANYYDENSNAKNYLILFNNFIQDGYCQIRKFYTAEQMKIPTASSIAFLEVVKRQGSADYYITTSNEDNIYHFKIDIVEGNSLEIYNYVDDGNVTSGTYTHTLQIVYDTLVLMELWRDEYGSLSCKKLSINLNGNVQSSYIMEEIYYISIQEQDAHEEQLISFQINNFKYYMSYISLTTSGNRFTFDVIDLNADIKNFSYDSETYEWNEDMVTSFSNNYIAFKSGTQLDLFYYEIESGKLIKFSTGTFNGNFSQIKELKQFNLVNIVGINTNASLAYSLNVYSVGYSSAEYLGKNFLIPQYLNIYNNASDNSSLIYSRDSINRFLASNQLTVTFNVPNYLLNNTEINKEIVYGQSNKEITNNINQYRKNRFESLYLSYIYSIQIIDNTNSNNLMNTEGSNRIANSIWNLLDNETAACLKARITYEDLTTEIINLDIPVATESTVTFSYQVSGNIVKIEYLSNDENTVYATFRTNLTGTNTITQTIKVD